MPTLTDLRLAYRKHPETVPETVEEVKTDEPVKKTKKTKKVKEGE